MINLEQRLLQSSSAIDNALYQLNNDLRVASPAIIKSYNASTQTCSAQIVIREKILINNLIKDVEIPLCQDVPVIMFRGGGFSITVPVQSGDECLLIFSDACYNYWFSRGNVQNQQRLRRHDLSDAIAIVGLWSQPRALSNVATSSLQLRSDDGQTVIDVAQGTVTVQANSVAVQASQVAINGSTGVSINGKDWLTHSHIGVQSGTSFSGPVK